MFAVILTGGKQYRVSRDDVIRVEKLEANTGDQIEITEVLMLGGEEGTCVVGTPRISGAVVKAEVVEQTRNDKIKVFKMRRRQNYRRKKGHRQEITVLRIVDIVSDAA
ncbi:MAG: 50S ribosomal protein L21 [Alphaproteobacteria bacterium]